MRVFLDTNVLLDSLIERENPQFCRDADAILRAGKNGTVELYMSVLSVPTIAYVLKNVEVARKMILGLTAIVSVLPSLPEHVGASLEGPLSDIEDALQLLSARSGGCDLIVTRDLEGFRQADLPVISPGEFLGRILE